MYIVEDGVPVFAGLGFGAVPASQADCPAGTTFVAGSGTGAATCKVPGAGGDKAKPWYKRTSTWLVAGAVVVGGGIAVAALR